MHVFEVALRSIEGDTDEFGDAAKDGIGNVHQPPQDGTDDEARGDSDQDEVIDISWMAQGIFCGQRTTERMGDQREWVLYAEGIENGCEIVNESIDSVGERGEIV